MPRSGVVVLSLRSLGGIVYKNTLYNENAKYATSDYSYGTTVAGNLKGVIATVLGTNTFDVVVMQLEIGHNFNPDRDARNY